MLFSGAGIYFVTIAVENAYYEHRLMGLTVVSYRTITVDEFQQVDITGAKRQ